MSICSKANPRCFLVGENVITKVPIISYRSDNYKFNIRNLTISQSDNKGQECPVKKQCFNLHSIC